MDLERRRIAASIKTHGYDVTAVIDGNAPNFAYTVGLSETFGAELVLAGFGSFSIRDVKAIIDAAHDSSAFLERDSPASFEIPSVGEFKLTPANRRWTDRMLLAANAFYGTPVSATQILPPQSLTTIDVPDLSERDGPRCNRVWRYLVDPWDLIIPPTARAVTNIEALRGGRITEAARWEADEWELFAGFGPDVQEEDARRVSLWMLIAHDASLAPVADLAIGNALRRDSDSGPWVEWPPTS